ncbi:MAG: hypothetical protein PHW73_01900 [Atribacterota bacterium]|nr:hypothetical protein [Atribacterota bacterium]
MKIRFLIPMMALIFIFGFALACGGTSGESSAQQSEQSKEIEALVGSQMVVEDCLKSPSSANFPLIADDLVVVTKIKENEYFVNSYVDSENSFGAMIRTFYTCKVILDEDEYTVKDLKFSD